jgi:2-polyprenyl-3-methyl-5-hydroxy-6-metoxy-1,4-benzoquinol methylase
MRRLPTDPSALRDSWIYRQWWYYSVELLPGVVTKGQYPDDFPLLPRILMRNCDLHGATCLDLGSMEGLIPVLMHRGRAARVIATDAIDHCHDKMAALRHYYNAAFEFQTVGPMYELSEKLHRSARHGFDLINVSLLLYHVFSPLMVLAGVRGLLKKNGLMIVSTNVVTTDAFSMELNTAGRLQDEPNTFWYVSVKALDYLLRYLKLAPIDCLYLPHREIRSTVRYLSDVESGYLSVVCRSQDDVIPTADDRWMEISARQSWEYRDLIDWKMCGANGVSSIRYVPDSNEVPRRPDTGTLDLARAAQVRSVGGVKSSRDAHILRITDRA